AYWLSLGGALGFLLAGSVYWGFDFRPPPPPQRPNAVMENDRAAGERERTRPESAPSNNKAIGVPARHTWWLSPIPKSVSEKEKADETLARYTWWLTFFTGALAFAIVGLSIAAARLYDAWQNRIGVAKDAFDAATLSAKAFMSAERATLSVQINSETVADLVGKYAGSDRSVGTLSNELAAPGLVCSFRNIGRTAAILKELSNHLVLQPEFPPAADYRIRETMPEDLVVEAGKTSAVLGCLMETDFTVEKAISCQNRRAPICMYG